MPMYVLQLQAGAPTTTVLQTYLAQNVADAQIRQQLQQDADGIRAVLDAAATPAQLKAADLTATADPVLAYGRDGLIASAIAFAGAPGANAAQAPIAAFNATLKSSSSNVGAGAGPQDSIEQIAVDLNVLRTKRLTVAAYVDALEAIDTRIVAVAKKGCGDVQESDIAATMAARRLTTAAYASLLERVTETAERHTTTPTFAL